MRADPFFLHDLPERLVQDWYELNIYTEFDVQVAAYYWIRRRFERDRAEQWIVRTQPTLRLKSGRPVKPDVVIFKNTIPYDAIEFKCQWDGFNEVGLMDDVEKLRTLKTEYNLRHAYQVVVYDDPDCYSLPSRQKEPWMKNYLSFAGANVRRNRNGNARQGYAEARSRWVRWR